MSFSSKSGSQKFHGIMCKHAMKFGFSYNRYFAISVNDLRQSHNI